MLIMRLYARHSGFFLKLINDWLDGDPNQQRVKSTGQRGWHRRLYCNRGVVQNLDAVLHVILVAPARSGSGKGTEYHPRAGG